MPNARASLNRKQVRYNRNSDSRIGSKLRNLKTGGLLSREIEEHPARVNPKLLSPEDGPFELISNELPVIVFNERGQEIRVDSNRLVRVPTPKRREDPRS